MNLFNPEKFVEFNVENYIGDNAFVILSSFSRAAIRQGWTKSEVEEVFAAAKSGDYDNLCEVIADHSE